MRTVACLGLVLCLLPLACGGDGASTADGGPDAAAGVDGGGGDGGTGPDGSSQTDGGGGGDGGGAPGDFPSSSTIYQDVSQAGVDSEWPAVQTSLEQSGWGGPFQIDPSFTVLHADTNLAPRPFTQPQGAQPDCDTAPVPVPPGGNTEGYPDYFCASSGDDCHLIVYQGARLYELYQGSITGGQATGGTFTGSCLAVWDLTHDYWQPGNPFSRGEGCNGADAADMPIAPLLVTKAEIQAGKIAHAMRFTIKNSLIRKAVYVHPATHLGGPTGGPNTMPYGARLRLRSDYNLASLPSDAARTIAKALQTYGMYLDDGGGNYLFVSATTDVADVMDTHDLKALTPADFAMVDGGTRYTFSQQNCTRTVVSQ